jgi:hypothetical protein
LTFAPYPQEQLQVSGAVSNPNTIDFSIPTTDSGYNPVTNVWTIAVQSALPTISTNAAIINGYSQAGASQNTLSQADNAALTITINGAGKGTIDGLTIAQPGSQVSGLDIEKFGIYLGINGVSNNFQKPPLEGSQSLEFRPAGGPAFSNRCTDSLVARAIRIPHAADNAGAHLQLGARCRLGS